MHKLDLETCRDAILKTSLHVARRAKLYESGVVFSRNGKVVTLRGRALDNHIRQLKKELAALENPNLLR
jgi:hypothetical protein